MSHNLNQRLGRLNGLGPVVFLVAMLLNCNPSYSAELHPFHISIAEIEFNPESAKLEVSLKVHANDLEQSLRLITQKKIDIETDELDRSVEQFINRYFYLLPAKAAKKISEQKPEESENASDFPRSKCRYVGQELDTSWMWLYFELELPDTKEPLAIVDAVFLDRIERQINTVTFRSGEEKHGLKLTRKLPWAEVPWLDKQISNANKK